MCLGGVGDAHVALYDADHRPEPGSLVAMMHHLCLRKCHVVQGSTYIRRTDRSRGEPRREGTRLAEIASRRADLEPAVLMSQPRLAVRPQAALPPERGFVQPEPVPRRQVQGHWDPPALG